MAPIKPKDDASAKSAGKGEQKESRWVRAFSALSASNSISLAEVPKLAQISERQAQTSAEVFNAAVRALDKRMALSVAPETCSTTPELVKAVPNGSFASLFKRALVSTSLSLRRRPVFRPQPRAEQQSFTGA